MERHMRRVEFLGLPAAISAAQRSADIGEVSGKQLVSEENLYALLQSSGSFRDFYRGWMTLNLKQKLRIWDRSQSRLRIMKHRRRKGIEDTRDNHQTVMAGRTRSIHNDVLVDRISDLPDNIIDYILNGLSLCDMVKTSVLSKSWRHCWKRTRKLEFDPYFYWRVVHKSNMDLEKVIDSVLSQHCGSADKFLIYSLAPRLFAPHKMIDFSQWSTKLTNKGVKEFTLLAYMSSSFRISSDLFKCPRLERVTLRRCEVKCSDNLENFGNVVYLNLDCVIVSDESMGLLISKFPHLETLHITFTEHGSPFVLNAHKLKTLLFCSAMPSKPLRLSHFSSLTVAQLFSELEIPLNYPEEPKLSSFIYHMPNIEKLVMNYHALKSLAERNLQKQNSRTFENLKRLVLWPIDISSIDQIMCAFCLIRSSPNLLSLEIKVAEPAYPNEERAVADFLESQISNGKLSGIKTVKYFRYAGVSHESLALLMKVIHSCCPMLENVET